MHSHPRHIVHLVYRFAAGGLENVVVQLINHLPHDEFRHTIVAIAGFDTTFVTRIKLPDVEVISLNKGPGQPFKLYPKMFKLLRRLRPDVLHSCNLAAMEFMPVATLSGVPLRVHVEHGWDVGDLGGGNAHYNLLRKIYKPFVNEFVAVAEPLHAYLLDKIGVPPEHLQLIPNGVDTQQFRPPQAGDALPAGWPFARGVDWVIGYVGRLVEVKNPLLLVDTFVALIQSGAPGTERMRLAMIGAGPLDVAVRHRMHDAGLIDRLWLPGVRADVADIFRALDCFVLPSLFEATSCTLQEAMATGLKIVATNVGGNAALLENGRCGTLVPSEDAVALGSAILTQYVSNMASKNAASVQQEAAMGSIQRLYGLDAVVARYRELFLAPLK
ncbi:TIGR03088 family PEP-CTERM/XrtA system glycosyltransferase [Rhodoferax sp.]|uniref:TIGR03088 family PEP-CTERM/XrtA system glycosyltransferase n=1 Tax=Rhodoferax sp. TaxID=50421 RepID=UPI00283BC943|nr:TIGR03088 family PEP-CTERM/XrtA system glycosyltransferase [Rhodoferax sp.]MDR3368494.1 TIGR03088 family PEP-CTERM/XrtA system glycosyltransferase [Rhodoferax sp.]